MLGVAAVTPFVYFIVDLVESCPGTNWARLHPYLRVVIRNQLIGGRNVVILGTIEDSALGEKGSIVLLEQERHATGSVELELPRGFGEPNLSGEANALRELREETGFVGTTAYYLGNTFTDTGMTDAKVFFYHVPIAARTASSTEIEEAMVDIRLASFHEIWELTKNGTIRDGFTLQAFSLFEKHYKSLPNMRAASDVKGGASTKRTG